MGKRISFAIGAATIAAAVAPAPALGASAERAANPGGGTGTGGLGYVAQPAVRKVKCLKTCASRKRTRGGSRIRVSGRNLAAVTRIVFAGGPGRKDDLDVRVRPRSERSVTVRVPFEAPSGPLIAWAGENVRSKASEPIDILPPAAPPPTGELTPLPGPADPGAPRLETGTSTARVFIGSRHGVTFSYRVTDQAPVNVKIELVRVNDGTVVESWTPAPVQPGQVQNLRWKGFAGEQAAPEGRYAFRLSASGSSGAQARSTQLQDVQRDSFDLYHHIFPVRGRHDYGGANADFGSGRAGHSHQGQDVFARCGTRMVAARGGVVKFKQYHGSAGHYLVIAGDKEGIDYAYMHLQQASPFDVGDRVSTGQMIGRVGDTGNASGCHLHFELWSAPGWYDGGAPFDPLPSLRGWDAFS